MQYLVDIGFGEERKSRLLWLKEHGYEGRLDEDYPYGTIFVDYGYFFGGNVTCFAASAMTGTPRLTWEKWCTLRGNRAGLL